MKYSLKLGMFSAYTGKMHCRGPSPSCYLSICQFLHNSFVSHKQVLYQTAKQIFLKLECKVQSKMATKSVYCHFCTLNTVLTMFQATSTNSKLRALYTGCIFCCHGGTFLFCHSYMYVSSCYYCLVFGGISSDRVQ